MYHKNQQVINIFMYIIPAMKYCSNKFSSEHEYEQ